MKELLDIAIKAAINAGLKTLEFYGKNIEVQIKDDESPLTLADINSNKIIVEALETTGLPILSEEIENASYFERKNWERFWLIDPLDGTKEFINHRKEYTINIALIEKGKPVMGVVYVPVMDVLYYSDPITQKAYKVHDVHNKELNMMYSLAQCLPIESKKDKVVVIASKSHSNADTEKALAFLSNELNGVEVKNYGSSLKLCMVAEGTADIYPRIGPTMEWDTGASHAVAEAAGCIVQKYPELDKLEYNKENLLNPFFIVYHQKYCEVVDKLVKR